MVRIAEAGAWLLALAVLASHAGALHPLADSLAVFRPQLATAALALSLIAAPFALRAAAPGLAAALSLGLLALPSLGAAAPGPIAVYQKNMLWNNGLWEELAEEILAADPDVLMMQEVTRPNFNVVEMLSETLPYAVRCPNSDGGPVIASRFEYVPRSRRCEPRLTAARFRTPHGEVTFASLHLLWPFPFGQAEHLETLIPILESLERPVVLGGDLNMVPWAHGPSLIAEAIGARIVLPAVPSYPLAPLATLPIDHVLSAGGGTAVRRPLAGSDHYGVLARVTP